MEESYAGYVMMDYNPDFSVSCDSQPVKCTCGSVLFVRTAAKSAQLRCENNHLHSFDPRRLRLAAGDE